MKEASNNKQDVTYLKALLLLRSIGNYLVSEFVDANNPCRGKSILIQIDFEITFGCDG